MTVLDNVKKVVKELEATLTLLDKGQTERFIDTILAAQTIFIAGTGRSGLMMRAFAMRLMHIGFQVHVAGDVTTPAIRGGDLLIIGSGSGETSGLVSMAAKARSAGATIAILTGFPNSSLGSLANSLIRIPAPTPKSASESSIPSIQPMGSLFEQSLLLVLDATIMRLMEKKQVDSAEMFSRHANLE